MLTRDTQAVAYGMVGGCRMNDDKTRYMLASANNKNGKAERYILGSKYATVTYPELQRRELVLNDSSRSVFVDGKLVFTQAAGDFAPSADQPVYMFAGRN